jgi:hypothetical protein
MLRDPERFMLIATVLVALVAVAVIVLARGMV